MTEAQARELAQALLKRIRKQGPRHKAEGIAEALLDAYNSGWENGFEEGKGTRW